ncbi:hypothetical protein RB597_001951 [Gaeumannomyces tritici]
MGTQQAEMGFLLQSATAALALFAAAPTVVQAAKFCDGPVCYSEFVSTQRVAYRVAVPDTAARGTAFEVLIQIVAPRAVGWAALAWGGQMTNNPLTIAYSNGGTGAVVSSRRAVSRTAPSPYPGASYAVFGTSTTNATHWRLDVLCSGCSAWTGGSVDPAGAAVTIAWASSARAPTTPSSNTSTIAIHDNKARVAFDLAAGRIANFTQVVAAKRAGGML